MSQLLCIAGLNLSNEDMLTGVRKDTFLFGDIFLNHDDDMNVHVTLTTF